MSENHSGHLGTRTWGIAAIALSVILVSSGFAQNVSVSDYQVPVSAANRLFIDLSANHVTQGEEATTSQGKIRGVYKRFYDSLPFGYSIDGLGLGSVDKEIDTDTYRTDYEVNGTMGIKKYLSPESESMKDLFGSVRLDTSLFKGFDRPASAATIGVGYGRFIEATPLAKAVRIEEFLIKEGEIRGHLPKETILELSHIIARRQEYEDKYGDTFKKDWYADMEAVMREAGMLTANNLGAIGVLRIEEVLERENIADRFYGWEVTLGSRFDISLPHKGQSRSPVNVDISINYARPISWKWQFNERLSANTPVDDPFKAFVTEISSDIFYELSNRVDFQLGHLLRIDKLKDLDAQYSNSLAVSLIYYIENYINLVAKEDIRKRYGERTTTNFTLALNYRVF